MDWFVDPSAAGANTGLTPADAATSVLSLISFANSVKYGDFVWLRRSFTIQASWNDISIQSGTTWNPYSHSMSWLIGWPQAGEPWYDQRPVSAVSAGWDVDSSAPHNQFPSFVMSGGNSSTLGWYPSNGLSAANIAFMSTRSNNLTSQWHSNLFNAAYSYKWNCEFTNIRWAGSALRETSMWDVTLCFSLSFTPFNNHDNVCIRKLTISQSTVDAGALFSTNGAIFQLEIEEVYIKSNSFNAIVSISDNAYYPVPRRIRKVHGTFFPKSFCGVSFSYGNATTRPIVIDDYYGNGPVHVGGGGSPLSALGSTASYSGSPAFTIATRSSGVAADVLWGAPPTLYQHESLMRKFIQVVQDVPVVAKVPIYAHNCRSLENAELRLIGGVGATPKLLTTVNSGIQPGSSGLWAGSTTAGSAYYAYARWVPQYTGSAWIHFVPPANKQISSSLSWMFIAPTIEVGSL